MSYFHDPDGVKPLVFGGGTWTRTTSPTSQCPAGGTSHMKITAAYLLPQPAQDPITLLTGHGHQDRDRRLHRRRFRRQVCAHRRLEGHPLSGVSAQMTKAGQGASAAGPAITWTGFCRLVDFDRAFSRESASRLAGIGVVSPAIRSATTIATGR